MLLVGLIVGAAEGVCEIDGSTVGLKVKEGANVGCAMGLLVGFAVTDGAAETVGSKVGLFVVPMAA